MSPEQIGTLTALAGIIKSIGTWPVLSIVVLVLLGPWATLVALSVFFYRWFESMKRMYEDNVELVKTTQELGQGYREQLIYTTEVTSEATSVARNNLFCPAVRAKTNAKGG